MKTYPLSPMQTGMLVHSLEALHPGTYIQHTIVRLSHQLDIASFERAWNQAVERHDALRTGFQWQDGRVPLQIVHDEAELSIIHEDWRDVPPSEWEGRLRRALLADLHRGFDLTVPPLLRLFLYRLADDDYYFVFSFHHCMVDGTSMYTVLREVFGAYEAYRQGREWELPRPRPYQDYIDWITGRDLASAEEYWRNLLATYTSKITLGSPHKQAKDAELRPYGDWNVDFSPQLTGELEALAFNHGATLNLLAQACWAMLLSRYSGECDIVFGSTRSCGRGALEGIRLMVGMFLNTLPVRVRLDPEMRCLDLIKDLRRQHLDARIHEHTPLAEIQKWSGVPRGAQLFETFISYQQRDPNLEMRLSCEDWEHRKLVTIPESHYPLSLVAYAEPHLRLKLVFDRSHFDEAEIERMASHLRMLLESLLAGLDRRIGDLPPLTDAELRQTLVEWNQTRAETPCACAHQLVERQVEETPDAIAVVWGSEQLSYRELNVRANQLANFLRARGIGPDVLAGVCIGPSLEVMVGLLGILKAGGAYAPLDPSYPQERLAYMLSDARPVVLLTQNEFLPRLSYPADRIICLDSDWESIERYSRDNPEAWADPDNLLYVVYTSGSTGRPKGIAMPHRPMVNLHVWASRPEREVCWLRTLQLAPVSFDVSYQEIFNTLGSGGALVIASPECRLDPELLLHYLSTFEIRRLNLPPVLLNGLGEAMSKHGAAGGALQGIAVTGEQLRISPAVVRLFEKMADCGFVNHYGPSETHLLTQYQLSGASSSWPALPSIGRPIDNTEIYILDRFGTPVPVEVAGELYAGGIPQARGYLGRPDLTAEKFLPNAFSTEPGGRLYRTGDVVRWKADGNAEFLGRVDRQVKIRGNRVEPAEIEAVLCEHEAVGEAAVIVAEQRGDKQLVAYVVNREGKRAPSSQELRDYLKQRLPAYAAPSSVIAVDKFPVTPSGKLDRQALPVPAPTREDREDGTPLPQTPTAELLSAIWTDVLNLDRLGAEANFFDLGGHSLLAAQVMVRVREAFRVSLPISTLFDNPTISDFTRAVEEADREDRALQIEALRPAPRTSEMPLSFGEELFWFLNQLNATPAPFNVMKCARLIGTLDVPSLERSLVEMVNRHENLRTSFHSGADRPFRVIARSPAQVLDVIDLRKFSKDERASQMQQIIEAEGRFPFVLSKPPLFRARLLWLDEQEHILVLVVHHMVCDGWSLGIIAQELRALYLAFSEQRPSPLSDLPIQYADYAVWQRRLLEGETLEALLTYWQQHLNGSLNLLPLPADRIRPQKANSRGRRKLFDLSLEQTSVLKSVCRREGVTSSIMLLAALKMLLFRQTGVTDIVVGVQTATRASREVERLVGYFVNTLPLHTEIFGHLTFRELLRRVREASLNGYARQELPFELLLRSLRGHRSRSHSPVFQAVFNFQNLPGAEIELNGLITADIPVGLNNIDSQVDFALGVEETCERLRFNLICNADLYSEARLLEWAEQFKLILDWIPSGLEAGIGECSLVSSVFRETLAAVKSKQKYPAPVHFRISEWARATPAHSAVIDEGRALSYHELDTHGNLLAQTLLGVGIGASDLVAICGARGAALAAALLGVLKTGAAFVMVDPADRSARVGSLLGRPNLRAWIQLEGPVAPPEIVGERLLVFSQFTCDPLDPLGQDRERQDPGGLSNCIPADPRIEVNAEDLAGLIMIDGPGGIPETVVVTHGELSRLLQWVGESLNLNARDRFGLLSDSPGARMVQELFMPLWVGGTLCIPQAVRSDAASLSEWLRAKDITVIHLSLGAGRALAARSGEMFPHLRYAFLSGGALTKQDVLRLRRCAPSVKCINLFPAPGTRLAAGWFVAPENETLIRELIPIGTGIAGAELLVMNGNLQLAGVGEPGEIYIYNPHLDCEAGKKAYLNGNFPHPQLVAESVNGRQLLRTGEMGRYLPDGNIDVGPERRGEIRNYLISFAEVEAALLRHPSVAQATVIATSDHWERKHLTAYIAYRSGATSTSGEIREFLKRELPDFMIPSIFEQVERRLEMPEGKVGHLTLNN